IFYLAGEWLGRSSRRMRVAIIIAAETAALYAAVIGIPLGFLLISLMPPTTSPSLRTIGTGTAVAIYFLSMFVPLGIGAYRGARYKTYYDFAFFAERLPLDKRREAAQYISMIADDYRGKVPLEVNAVVKPA